MLINVPLFDNKKDVKQNCIALHFCQLYHTYSNLCLSIMAGTPGTRLSTVAIK